MVAAILPWQHSMMLNVMIEMLCATEPYPPFPLSPTRLIDSIRNSINRRSAYNCTSLGFFGCFCSLCIAVSLHHNILCERFQQQQCYHFHATINPGAHTNIFLGALTIHCDLDLFLEVNFEHCACGCLRCCIAKLLRWR